MATKVTMGSGEPEVIMENPVEEVVQENVEPVLEEEAAPVTSLDDLDPAEELWPDGPTVADIKAWKEVFGSVYITSVDVDNHYVWRKMQRPEYKNMLRVMEQATNSGQMSNVDASMFNEEYVTQMCTLFPAITKESFDTIDAGIPSIISQQVMDASGFVALEVREL